MGVCAHCVRAGENIPKHPDASPSQSARRSSAGWAAVIDNEPWRRRPELPQELRNPERHAVRATGALAALSAAAASGNQKAAAVCRYFASGDAAAAAQEGHCI